MNVTCYYLPFQVGDSTLQYYFDTLDEAKLAFQTMYRELHGEDQVVTWFDVLDKPDEWRGYASPIPPYVPVGFIYRVLHEKFW